MSAVWHVLARVWVCGWDLARARCCRLSSRVVQRSGASLLLGDSLSVSPSWSHGGESTAPYQRCAVCSCCGRSCSWVGRKVRVSKPSLSSELATFVGVFVVSYCWSSALRRPELQQVSWRQLCSLLWNVYFARWTCECLTVTKPNCPECRHCCFHTMLWQHNFWTVTNSPSNAGGLPVLRNGNKTSTICVSPSGVWCSWGHPLCFALKLG